MLQLPEESKESKIMKRKKEILYLIENDKEIREAILRLLFSFKTTEMQSAPAAMMKEKYEKAFSEKVQALQQEYQKKFQEQRGRYEIEMQDNALALQQERNAHAATKEKQRKLEEEKTQLLAELEAIQTRCRTAENTLEKYNQLETIYRKYCSLSAVVLKAYDFIINRQSSIAFVLSGSNADNIKLFYEKICMEWKKYDDDILNTLNEVFDYLFEMFQVNHPNYSRIKTVVGDEFRLELHTRTADSLPVGKITQVIISGYTNDSGTKKNKSFVKIG